MGYEEALRRIEEAAETGAMWLDLRFQQLIDLPPELFQLKNLTMLDLSDNPLSSLPPEIAQLKSLTELDLDNNLLSSLPPEIVQLKNLTTLDPAIINLTTHYFISRIYVIKRA